MKMKNVIAFMTAVLVVAQVQISFGQKADKTMDGWTLLGTRVVDYTLDRDVISLKENDKLYTALKFKVKNGTLNMHKATVHFANGDVQDIEFPAEIDRTNDGRKIDLAGNMRNIDKVTFWYDTKNSSNDKSIVEVWAKM